ncbi:hypothetical protein [Pseudothermotoga sp.]
MRRYFRIYLICCVLVLLLFGCGAPQEQKPTIQKLAEDLVGDDQELSHVPHSA